MTTDIRYSAKYRRIFAEILPRFTINEIEPIFKQLGHQPENPLTVFDVGANMGFWSLALVRHSGPWIGKMHLFEPMPGNLERIESVRSDGLYGDNADNITINRFALSDTEGTVDIHFENDVTGFASIDSATVHLMARSVDLPRHLSIETQTLDAYCAAHDIGRIDILKIDVEGHEMAVLKGAQRMLSEKRIRCIVYEIGPHQMVRREFYKDFFDFFVALGYDNYRYRDHGWAPVKIGRYLSSLEQFDQVCMRMAVLP